MDNPAEMVGQILFDPEENLLHPFELSAIADPITIQDKFKEFAQLFATPPTDNESFMNFLVETMTLASRPISVPTLELVDPAEQPSERPIIVMGPTIGHTPILYNFLSQADQSMALANQMLACGWEMTRQGLIEMGANVVVTPDLYRSPLFLNMINIPPFSPISAPESMLLPVQQIFTRDSGVIIDDTYYLASSYSIYESLTNASRMILGDPSHSPVPIDALVQLASTLKQQHGLNVINAFRHVGKHLNRGTIDAFFEGGDVFVDARKGIVLIGDDSKSNELHDLTENAQNLHEEFQRITGKPPVVIKRPFSLAAENRGDGERFHLDCFMSLLPKGELLVDPRFTTPQSLETLKNLYDKDIIEIGPENVTTVTGPSGHGEVPNYTANLVAVGNQLLMPSCSPELKTTLQKHGYSVVTAENFGVPAGLLYMRGGSIHCVTQTLPSIDI